MTVEADSQSVLLTGDGTHSAESQRTDTQGEEEETFSLFTLTHQTSFKEGKFHSVALKFDLNLDV